MNIQFMKYATFQLLDIYMHVCDKQTDGQAELQ